MANFKFLILSDTQNQLKKFRYNPYRYKALRNCIQTAYFANPDIAFTIICGDVTERSNDEQQIVGFKNAINGIVDLKNVYCVIGNHDLYARDIVQSPYHYDFKGFIPQEELDKIKNCYQYPENWIKTFGRGTQQGLLDETTYSMVHENVAFFFLNTAYNQYYLDEMEAYYDAQAKWLETELGKHQDKFKIVVVHVPFSKVNLSNKRENEFDEPVVKYIYDRYTQMMRTQKVNLILQGHEHIAAFGKVFTLNAYCPGKGGAEYLDDTCDDLNMNYTYFENINHDLNPTTDNHYTVANVTDKNITLDLHNSNGVLLKTFTITK